MPFFKGTYILRIIGPHFASYEKTMILLNLIDISVTKYSRMDQVKFVKDTDFQKFEVIWSALSL